LSRFFRGRTLDSEARRFLALTRYGQSRAVSEGVPMLLWVDPQQGAYGLRAETSYSAADTNAVQFVLEGDLRIEVEPAMTRALATVWRQTTLMASNRPAIRFTPDGFISETSPERVLLREGDDDAVYLGQSRTRLHYEIQTNLPPLLRR
jgi:Tfp pilus assembly protein FimT